MPCNSRLDQNLSLRRWATVALFASAFVVTAQAQETPAGKDASAKQTQSGQHDGVLARGDHAMGFSHETTTHHFRLYKTGGAIEVLANDAKDSASRDQIRMHLAHIAKLFTAGDF